jgi:hypothetical protein
VPTSYLILLLFILAYNLICNVYNVSNPIQSMQFTLYQRLQIGTLLAADRMHRVAGRAGQAGQTTTQIMSCTRRKRTRRTVCIGRMHRPAKDALTMLAVPYCVLTWNTNRCVTCCVPYGDTAARLHQSNCGTCRGVNRAPSTDLAGLWHGSSRFDLEEQNNQWNVVMLVLWLVVLHDALHHLSVSSSCTMLASKSITRSIDCGLSFYSMQQARKRCHVYTRPLFEISIVLHSIRNARSS